jgi:iron(III) transport system ATP-binding protein
MTRTTTRPDHSEVRADGLRVAGIRKAYGAVEVLHGIDLAVPAGSLTAVLGRSGCGKTTLLRLIAGFDRPDAGTITIDGHEVATAERAVPPEDRRIGYVTQDGNLFPHLTVAGNIAFGLPRRARRASPRVAELLDLVGLGHGYGGRYPHELSGGQQQRVALARALAPGPGLVLLDEPFSALDAELRESTRRAVATALAASGTTTVLVTHDQAEALSLATDVAVMREGRIVQQARPTDLYRRPVDRDVAAFVGDVVLLPAVARSGLAHCALGALGIDRSTTDGPVTVMIRPEQIAIDGGPDAVTARVLDVEFHGHDAVLRLALAAPSAPTELTARCPSYALPAVGEQVGIVVRGGVSVES